MYNSIIGTSFTSSYLQFTNNFYAEWQVDKNWKATARIGVSEKRNDMDDAITGSGGYEPAYETAEKSKFPEELD